MDEWGLLAKYKDMKEKARVQEEHRLKQLKQQQFRQVLDNHSDVRQKTSLLKRNMDVQIDQNMLEYDRMMQERHDMGEGRRYNESR